MICRFLPAAEIEHLDQVAWYEQRQPGLGARYLAAVQGALDHLVEAPHRFPRLAGTDMRRIALERFPFTIYFAERDGGILVVAIAAHRRRPGYWANRL